MKLTTILLWLITNILLICSINAQASEEVKFKAGVAPGFSNGMHARLLSYISEHLGIEVDIIEAPLKRRLVMLQNGQLDLAVAVLKTPNRQLLFNFIEPEYTTRVQEERLYLLKKNFSLYDPEDPLSGKTIAILRGSNIYQSFTGINKQQLFETVSLDQSINLLLKERVNYFLYAKKTADKKLTALGLTETIYESPILPTKVMAKKVYMAISKHSFLNQYRLEFEQIAKTLNKGEYNKLHELHYGKD